MKIKLLRLAVLITALFALLMSCAAAKFSDFLELPSGIKTVHEQSFSGTENLIELILPEGIECIESRAFAGSGLKHVNLPDSIRYIAPDAFEGCEDLKALYSPDSYAAAYCAEAGIAPDEPPLVLYILQYEKELNFADAETAMDAAFALAASDLPARLRIHSFTASSAEDQSRHVQAAAQAKADMALVNLADAASAEAVAQTFAEAKIPVLFFNAEPDAAAVSALDCVFVGSKNGSRANSEALAKACVQIAVNRLRTGGWLPGSGYTSANGWSVLLDPQYRLAGLKIGIDPGHQRRENSALEPIAPGSSKKKPKVSSGTYGVATKTPEYVRVLQIAKKLRASLQALGAEVYMTRETHNVNISNRERALMMNELGVDLVLRIHCDGASAASANGISIYVRKSGTKAKESYNAAAAILPAMIKATGAYRRGVKKSNEYTGLNWSTVPCALVECGFMTNKAEDKRLADPKYQQKLADGMTNGICKYFGR